MKVDDQKYIAFRRSDFYELMGELALPPFAGHEEASAQWDCAPLAERIKERCEQACISDAVIIRRQDVFAAPALEAYANAIVCVVEALRVSGSNGEQAEQLMEIADYFHEQAEKSYSTQRRMPTP